MPRGKKKLILSSTNDQSNCRLLGLPAELRNRIYELTFEEETCHVPCRTRLNSKALLLDKPEFLLACKQIYAEAIKIYYGAATFNFDKTYRLEQWMRRIGPRHGSFLTRVLLWKYPEHGWGEIIKHSFLALYEGSVVKKAKLKEGVLTLALLKTQDHDYQREDATFWRIGKDEETGGAEVVEKQ